MAGESGTNEIAVFEHILGKAATWRTLWQDLADYGMPRKSAILERKTADVEGWTDNIYNNDAVHAIQVASAGTMDYLFSGNWFDFDPPPQLKNSARAERFYRECAEQTRMDLANSNFNTAMHERILDRNCFGTNNIGLKKGTRNFFNFTGVDVGNFFAEEDSEGYVGRIWELHENMTACQIVEEFTDGTPESLMKLPETVRKDYADPKRKYNKHPVIRSIRPRKPSEMNKGRGRSDDKPIASIWTHRESKQILRNSGLDEHECFVSRYLKWGGEAYGYCPMVEILPITKQVNFIEMLMDTEAELKVFPRMLWPSNMPGNIQLHAGGVTVVDPNNVAKNDLPREWLTGGDMRDMAQRLEAKKDAINRAYHVDLFTALESRKHKQMTAYEVSQIVAEKIVNFSPTYGRITTELSTPMLNRAFSLSLEEGGRYPKPPPEVVNQDPITGEYGISLPKIAYTSKIALALKSLQNQNFMEYMQIMGPVFEMNPSAAIGINWEGVSAKVADNLGLPVAMQHPDHVVQQLKAEQAQMAQAQQMAEVVKTGSEAAKNLRVEAPAAQ